MDGVRAALRSRTLRMGGVLVLLWAALALHPETREAFVTAQNLSNLTAQVAEIVILGVGMTMVILIGGIDLSVGAGMALCGVVAAKLQIDLGQPAWVAVGAALAVGTLLGLWHGVLVTALGIPPFVATLGGFLAYRGLALVISDARGLSPMGRDFALLAGKIPGGAALVLCAAGWAVGLLLLLAAERRRRSLGLPAVPAVLLGLRGALLTAVAGLLMAIYQHGLPVPVLLAALVTAFGAVLLGKSRLGRWAVAVGGNAEAALLSGVPVRRVMGALYLLLGTLTGLAGVVAAARTNGVTPGNAGVMRELHVITAVVIGGTSLKGGTATMAGTVIGAVLFGTLSNGMNLMNVNSNWQLILTGAILLGASLLDSLSARKRHS